MRLDVLKRLLNNSKTCISLATLLLAPGSHGYADTGGSGDYYYLSSPPAFAVDINLSGSLPKECGPYAIGSACWAKDSSMIAIGVGSGSRRPQCQQGYLQIFDMSGGKPVLQQTIQTTSIPLTCDFNPDGSLLAAGEQFEVELFNLTVNPATRAYKLASWDWGTRSFAFSPSGEQFVFSGWSSQIALIETGNEYGTTLVTSAKRGIIRGLRFSMDGSLLAAGGSGNAWIFNMSGTDYKPAHTLYYPYNQNGHYNDLYDLAFNEQSGQMVAGASDGTVGIYNMTSLNTSPEIHNVTDGPGPVRKMDVSPDGALLAVGGENGKTWIMDAQNQYNLLTALDNGKESNVTGYNETRSVSFSRDGQWLETSGLDGVLRLYKVEELGDGENPSPSPSVDPQTDFVAATQVSLGLFSTLIMLSLML